MTDFPTIVYKTPGPHGRTGKTYAYMGVADQAAFDAAIKNGWHPSKADAFEGKKVTKVVKEVQEAQDAIDEVSPATREEMEQRAKELGMRNAHRMKDETLAEKLAEHG